MTKSRVFIAFLVAIIFGIFLGDVLKIDQWWSCGLFLGFLIFLIFSWKSLKWRFILLISIGFLFGLGYYRFWDDRQNAVKIPYNREINFNSQIVSFPESIGNQTGLILKYQNTKIQIRTGRFPEYSYGDNLKIKGVIKKPNEYLYYRGITGVISNPEKIEKIESKLSFKQKTINLLYFTRNQFESSLNKTLREPFASFAAGIILGSKRNIPDSLMTDFNRTGTTHIVAVSGYNVTILVVNIAIIIGIFSRKLKFWGSILIILGFVIMTGASASVVRAGLLAALVAFGQFEGRRINMTILLLLVASLMLLYNPYDLKHDISFELSFLAFAGLIYLGPIIAKLKFLNKLPSFLRNTFSETLGAQLLVLPILIFYFGQVSLSSPIVNILVLPLIPCAMGIVLLLGLCGIIWLPLGIIVGYLGEALLKYIIIVVEYFSKIPWTSWKIETNSWWWMIIFYVILGIFIYKNKEKISYEEI